MTTVPASCAGADAAGAGGAGTYTRRGADFRLGQPASNNAAATMQDTDTYFTLAES